MVDTYAAVTRKKIKKISLFKIENEDFFLIYTHL